MIITDISNKIATQAMISTGLDSPLDMGGSAGGPSMLCPTPEATLSVFFFQFWKGQKIWKCYRNII